jgi:two-component system phosphate regulon sensor histidine kinase PhoR
LRQALAAARPDSNRAATLGFRIGGYISPKPVPSRPTTPTTRRSPAPLSRELDQLADDLSRTVTELRSERDLLGRILEAMEEGVLVLDEARRVVLLNRALSSMLLVSPQPARRADAGGNGNGGGNSNAGAGNGGPPPSPLDVAGRLLSELTPDPNIERLLDMTVTHGERATGEINVGDLKPRRLLVRVTRLSGAPWCFLMVFVDVTEMRRLESLRRDFVANVSHELRTPVAALRSAAETLRMAMARDPLAAMRFLAIIERNADRLSSLVQDLLDLSRIESREYRLNVESLDLAKVLSDVLTLYRERADSRRIRLLAEIDPGGPRARTDRRALEQVLVNLVDNSVKYCPEEARITLRAERAGEDVRITVTDTGPGIDPAHLPRLFERFYRVDPGRSRDRGGTGLGLAIVKHLVDAMGGTVTVESTIGRGTTFTVTLPAAGPPAARTEGPLPPLGQG